VHRDSIRDVPTFFCSVSVKYEPISIKMDRHVLVLNKTVHKVPTSPEIRSSTTLGNLK